MKQALLLLNALILLGCPAYAQTNKTAPEAKPVKQNNFIRERADAEAYFPEKSFKPTVANPNKVQAPPYRKISSSHNAFTALVSRYNCLTYNKNINMVMFTHRKSKDWAFTTPKGANSGSIQSTWTSNNGTNWDSTIVWVDSVRLARYPSGAIYNPTSNTNPANAKTVVMGSVTTGTWTDNYFSSGPLTSGAITTSGMLGVPIGTVNINNGNSIGGAIFETRMDVQEANGTIWGVGGIYKDYNGADAAAWGFRGAAIIKASTTDNGATFVWKSDSIKPNVLMNPKGYGEVFRTPQLAFSQDGQTGYVIFYGIEAGATGAKKTYQPIVYKTTNGGTTWAQVNAAYDWTTHACLMSSIKPTIYGTSITKPYFTNSFGADAAVDNQGRLHLVCTVASAYSDDADSLDWTRGYNYSSYYPYVWDFVTSGNGTWTEYFVDSLMTKDLDATQAENQWIDGTGKEPYDNRLQVSKTPDGSRIFVGWLDSDPAFTGNIYNIAPDIFVRGINTSTMAMSARKNMNNNQQDAYWMFMSTTTAEPAAGQFRIPFTYTLSRGATFDALQTVDHYYVDDATMSDSEINIPYSGCAVSINESKGNIESVSQNYPNPFDRTTTIKVALKTAEDIHLSVYNTMGQLVSTKTVKGTSGMNAIDFEANNLTNGIYFYTIKVGNNSLTKKMYIQK